MLIDLEKSKIYKNMLLCKRHIYQYHIMHNRQCLYAADIPSTNKFRNSGPVCRNIWYPALGEEGHWSLGSPIRQGDVWFGPCVVDTPVTNDILSYRGCGQTGGCRHWDIFMLICNVAIVPMMICIYINMCPKNHHSNHTPHFSDHLVFILQPRQIQDQSSH